MAKEWIKVEFVTRNGKVALEPITEKKVSNKKAKTVNLRTIPSLSAEDLIFKGEKTYFEKKDEEDSLVEAYNNKKLKSKEAIKKAKIIIAKKEKEKIKKSNREKIINTNSKI